MSHLLNPRIVLLKDGTDTSQGKILIFLATRAALCASATLLRSRGRRLGRAPRLLCSNGAARRCSLVSQARVSY